MKKKFLLTLAFMLGITSALFASADFGSGTSFVTSGEASTLSVSISTIVAAIIATLVTLSTPMLYKYFGNRVMALIERIFGGK